MKVPEICLGGSLMLVESRRVRERRLRPQTGYLVQHLSCYRAECLMSRDIGDSRGFQSSGCGVEDHDQADVCQRSGRRLPEFPVSTIDGLPVAATGVL